MTDIINLEPRFLGGGTGPMPQYWEVPNAAMQVIQDVINASWNEATTTKEEFSAKVTAALSGFLDTLSTPHVSANAVAAPTIAEPGVAIPETQSAGDVLDEFNTQRLAIVAELAQKFVDFRASYFPDESSAYSAAENWLQQALANPAGLPPTVVAQIFGNDQARILADKTRAQDAVIAQFAGRRFPLPPDVAASAVMQLEQKAQDELAESSRKVAMLSVEMQKFNVEKLLGLRSAAMDAATKYINALASGQDVASRVVGVGYDAQSKLISAAATFYNARTQAADTISKVAQYNASTQLEAAAKNQLADLQMVENKLKALLAEAQSIAQMTTALYNNLHTGATLSGTAHAGTTVSTTA